MRHFSMIRGHRGFFLLIAALAGCSSASGNDGAQSTSQADEKGAPPPSMDPAPLCTPHDFDLDDSDCVGRPQASRIHAKLLLAATELGGAGESAVTLDPRTGTILHTYHTGNNTFGTVLSADGKRGWITDKTDNTLVELDLARGGVLGTFAVGATPTFPSLTSDGRMYVPVEGGIEVYDVNAGAPQLLRTISTGTGSKPHIVSLSPDATRVWASVQGIDPKIVSLEVTPTGEGPISEYRYNIVPTVATATNFGGWFSGFHSTGIHFADLKSAATTTPYIDVYGTASPPMKQMERVAPNAANTVAAITHIGRKALIVLTFDAQQNPHKRNEIALASAPYWVTLDPSEEVAYVSMPDTGVVEAYDITACSRKPLWSTAIGGRAKWMVTSAGAP